MDTCALHPAAAFQAEANLRALIESTGDLIWSVDLNYGLLTFNQALYDHIEQNFGVRAAVGMRPEDLLPPEQAALWPPLFQSALSEGPFQAEYSLIDGRTLEVAFNRIVQDGETTGISVFGKDITERKTAEAALRESEEKYRGIFEGAIEGIYRATPEGRTLTANPAVAQMLGYESAQELVSTITDSPRQVWLDSNERSQFLRVLEQQEAVRGYQCQWKRKDGTAIWVQFNGRRVRGTDGRTLCYEGFVQDITERKRAEEELRRNQALLQAVLDGTPDPIFLKDRECRTVMANPAALRAVGKPAEQVLGKSSREYIDDPEMGRAAMGHDLQVMEAGVAESVEETLPGPGGVRIFLATKSPYRDTEGRTIGIIGVSRDITKRKRAEEALRESERRLRTILETVSLVGIMLDRQANITLCNDYLLALTGWKREELLGRNWFEVFIPPEMHEEVNEVFLKIMDVGEFPAHHQHEIVTQAGERRLVEWNGTAIRDPGGQVVGLASIGVDITDRKRAEDKLRESEARLRQAQHLAHVGSSVWDVDSDTTTWSEEMYRITGRDPNGPAPTCAERVALYSPESWTRMSEAMQRGVATGEPYELDLDMVRADGAVRRTHASGAAVRDDRGRVVRLQGTLQDITDQKRAEEALQQTNRKLQQISRDLLRTQDYERRRIARELHDSTAQLLAALSINLGRLRDSELKPGRREQVLSETIDLAAACSAEIRTITYLLHPPLLEEIGLVHALRAYAQGFNQRTGIQVKIKIPPDFGRIGNERESTLFRIIQEGLANVHKHSGSRLAVIQLGRDPREVRLVLQDQGCGFTEAPRRRTAGFVHLGVGITGMRERAEQLGGRLEIASGDAGTTLTVTLPMVQSNEETADIVGG